VFIAFPWEGENASLARVAVERRLLREEAKEPDLLGLKKRDRKEFYQKGLF